MNVFIASDHGGLKLKQYIMDHTELIGNDTNFQFIDLGPFELDLKDDYPKYAEVLTNKIFETENSLGILICRSGIGMCIAANKFKSIYAALCFTPEHARKARQHNNANILCLDSDYGDNKTHLNTIKTFLESTFEGWDSRHGRRVNQIKDLENKNFK